MASQKTVVFSWLAQGNNEVIGIQQSAHNCSFCFKSWRISNLTQNQIYHTGVLFTFCLRWLSITWWYYVWIWPGNYKNINTAAHILPTTVPQHLQLDGFIFYDKECITIAMYPFISTTLWIRNTDVVNKANKKI
jgi:hypothetical protein